MLDEYIRKRFDRVADDVAIVRTKVESIERNLGAAQIRFDAHDTRLGRLERRLFAIWIFGPIAIGTLAFLKAITHWMKGI